MKILSANQSATDLIRDINGNFADVSPVYRDMIRVMHWNMGSFALGHAPTSAITTEEARVAAKKKWLHRIAQYAPDAILACECPSTFARINGTSYDTRDEIFGEYPFVATTVNVNGYLPKIIASMFNVTSYEQKVLGNEKLALFSTIQIAGTQITLVEAHLDWDSVNNRRPQMEELIRLTSDIGIVIIGGDFNNADITEYELFKEAGYSMANYSDKFGNIPTYPSRGSTGASNGTIPYAPIDNIITKGCSIRNLAIIDDSTLTDHCGLVCDLDFTQE